MPAIAPQHNPFAQLLAVAREVSFLKGAELVRQGEASRGAFLIRSGAAEARVALPGGGTLEVATFRDGDMFGETALIERGVCSATVVAHPNVDAWFVGRDDFRALVASREIAALDVQRTITRTLNDRLRMLNERARSTRRWRTAPRAIPRRPATRSPASSAHSRPLSTGAPTCRSCPSSRDSTPTRSTNWPRTAKRLNLRGAWAFVAGQPANACYLVVRGSFGTFHHEK